jgi:hypothetical protein
MRRFIQALFNPSSLPMAPERVELREQVAAALEANRTAGAQLEAAVHSLLHENDRLRKPCAQRGCAHNRTANKGKTNASGL